MKWEMSESRATITCEDIFGEKSSASSTSYKEALSQTAEKPRKLPETAPVRRMLLSLQQKLAAISHFQSNKMTHNELAQWMKKQFKLEKEIERIYQMDTLLQRRNEKTGKDWSAPYGQLFDALLATRC